MGDRRESGLLPRQNRHVTQFKVESLLHLVENASGELGDALLLNQLSEVVLVIVVETQSLEDVAESAIGCGASRGAPNLNLRSRNDAGNGFIELLIAVNFLVVLLLNLESCHCGYIRTRRHPYAEHGCAIGQKFGDVVVEGIDVDASEGKSFGVHLANLLTAYWP